MARRSAGAGLRADRRYPSEAWLRPVELFLDPALRSAKLNIDLTLLRRQLGFRALLEVTPLDATLVRGSHGRLTTSVAESPTFATQESDLLTADRIHATDVHDLLLRHLAVEAPVAFPAVPLGEPRQREDAAPPVR